MEVLRLPGYTEQEKHQIAKRFLVPRQLEATGVSKDNVQFTDETITHMIRHYTHEAGVRNLDREIANVCRKVARKVVEGGKNFSTEITVANVNDYLGVLKFRDFFAEKKNEVGLTTGLAWTEVGGSVLVTEAAIMQGKGRLTPTGKLGEVMQESAQAAMSYVRSRSQLFGLPADFYRHLDIHVHVPEGAIPKDGPSAGITICTSIVSALTRIPVRCDVAMTGEITLRGKVLPIGGVKEKLLAAHRIGLRTVLMPKDNEKDLAEIPPEIQAEMSIRFVESMDEVLQLALEQPLPIAGHPPVAGVEPKFGADVAQDNELTN
jgi:ATP-dependent Lon protease